MKPDEPNAVDEPSRGDISRAAKLGLVFFLVFFPLGWWVASDTQNNLRLWTGIILLAVGVAGLKRFFAEAAPD
ncbi:MAG: hypothetical protein JNM56_29055 [Planctomycetia bacterium]|nr:hypothetical protein [Planctomycetia bacterium]